MGSTPAKLKRRIRKTVKWGGAALTVLLVAVWIGSGWWWIRWTSPSGDLYTVGGGTSDYFHAGPFYGVKNLPVVASTPGWSCHQYDAFYFNWWVDWEFSERIKVYNVPLWFPTLLSLLATAAAWRADAKHLRRVREGACPACGYDRAGLAAGAVCPECGKQPEAR